MVPHHASAPFSVLLDPGNTATVNKINNGARPLVETSRAVLAVL
jgi:hypothetical protein